MEHGNSYQNNRLHHLYEIIDRVDDSVFKYGISFKPIGEDELSERMKEQVNLLNRIDKWSRFYARILIVDIEGKREARRLEIQHIQDYIKKYGERPRGNPTD